MTQTNPLIIKPLRFNLVVNILDGAFFGFALGFASFSTVIPLFVSSLTSSAILIGLIPAIHSAGFQLPQLLTARGLARRKQFKNLVLLRTLHERLPFLGLALIAWSRPLMSKEITLALVFVMLIWQGLGGGVTANPWQSMVAKIIPSSTRGTFLGAQSSALSLFASIGAIGAGFILEKVAEPWDYTYCFLIACVWLVLSFFSLWLTKEPETEPAESEHEQSKLWSGIKTILRRDVNFRWYLAARIVNQLAVMGFAFYTVYAVYYHSVSKIGVGWMTSVLLGTQIVANPILGWLGDHWNHHRLMEIGVVTSIFSVLTAWLAPTPGWFYLAFVLAGIANVASWTIGMAIILEFGNETERPVYIGLANTLIAPAAILAPFLGGWLADSAGYPFTFVASAICGVLATVIFHYKVRDPRHIR